MSEGIKETPDQKLERLEAQYSDMSKVIADLSKTNTELTAKLDASGVVLQKVVAYLQDPNKNGAQAATATAKPAGQAAPGVTVSPEMLKGLVSTAKEIIELVISAKTGLGSTSKGDPIEEMLLVKAKKNALKNLAVRSSMSDNEISQLIKTGKVDKDTIELLKTIDAT